MNRWTISVALALGACLGLGLGFGFAIKPVCDHGASSAAVKRVHGVIVVVQPEHQTGCR